VASGLYGGGHKCSKKEHSADYCLSLKEFHCTHFFKLQREVRGNVYTCQKVINITVPTELVG
jgi:hypothetical protein